MSRHDALERIVEALNETMLDDALWPGTSAIVDEAFGAKGNVLTVGRGDGRSRGNVEIHFAKCFYRGGDRSEWLRDYLENYHRDDEHLPRMRLLPDAKIVPVATLFSDEEKKTSRMYNEALPLRHGQKGLTIRLDGPGGSRIVWGIADPVDSNGWSSSRIDTIARVVPHVRQYVRVRSALIDAGAVAKSAMDLLGSARAGVVHLDRHARIVEANQVALELLRRTDGLFDRDGELRAVASADDDRLRTLIADALARSGPPGTSGSMLVERPAQRLRLAVHVKPVSSRETEGRSRPIGAIVLIMDPRARASVDSKLVETALGLTPAQARIAVLLAQGLTAPQIATATGRSYFTVRSHLRHIYARLGTARQYEVAQLVLALSNLPVTGR